MKIVLLTGSHLRHFYVANQIKKTGCVVGHIIEDREEFIPQPPDGLMEIDKKNFIKHFEDRAISEKHFFNEVGNIKTSVPELNVSKEELNSSSTIKWMKNKNADLIISYGVHKLSEEFLFNAPAHAWNIHGGLSPWYRGNTTLFWPFYNMKPNWAGMTVHRLTEKLDGGGIVHHSVPKLEYGDRIHDVANKAVIQVAKDLKEILLRYNLEEIVYEEQKNSGKLFTTSDWQPQHLRVIYNLFDNDIVDQYLKGNLKVNEPSLINILSNHN